MNFFIIQQKQKKAKQLRDMHSTRPKDYWRYLNNLKDKHTTKTPPLQDFYDYFKETNFSPNAETFHFEQTGFNEDDNSDILNALITETEITAAVRALKTGKSAGLDGILMSTLKIPYICSYHFTLNFLIQCLKLASYPNLGSKEEIIPSLRIREISRTLKITAP